MRNLLSVFGYLSIFLFAAIYSSCESREQIEKHTDVLCGYKGWIVIGIDDSDYTFTLKKDCQIHIVNLVPGVSYKWHIGDTIGFSSKGERLKLRELKEEKQRIKDRELYYTY